MPIQSHSSTPRRRSAPPGPSHPGTSVPDPWEFRHLRRLQQRLEAGFWRGANDDQWVQDLEVPLGSPDFHKLSQWYLRRKPFLLPKALSDYCRLLKHHMKGCTLTAHVSIDPEDGWLCLWFTVYGLPPLKRHGAIHEEHRAFLDALFAEGLHVRHTSGHIGLIVARGAYRPNP